MFHPKSRGKLKLCLLIFLLCITGSQVSAQSTFGNNTSPVNPSVLKVVPSIRGGYQHIGVNFSMPANLLPGSLLVGIPTNSESSIDFKLRNADVWLGAVRLDIESLRGWSFFVSGETSLKRNITTVTEISPLNLVLNRPVEWNGSGFQYWTLDAGGGFYFRNDWKAIGGLRYDRLTVRLEVGGGDYSSLIPPVPPPYLNQLLSRGGFGDFQQNLWIPYAGVELTGSNYKWNFIGSPFVATELKLPLSTITYFFSGGNYPKLGGLKGYKQNRQITYNYKITKPSVFLESNFEYTVNPWSTLALVGWLKGSWLHFRGHGSLDASTYVVDGFGSSPTRPFDGIRTQSASSSDSGTAEYNRYLLAIGISTQLTF